MTITLSSNTAWSLYNFRAGLIRALIERNEHVVVLSPHDEFSQRLSQMGCEVIDLPMDNKGTHPQRDTALFMKYRKIYRQLKPSLALHYTIKPVIYGSLAAHSAGIPCINTITGLGTAFIRDNWLTRIAEGLYKVSQRNVAQVFFQNNDDMSLFQERRLVPLDRLQRLPGSGVNLEHFAVTHPPAMSEPTFLLIARLLWDKGVGEFVEAARLIKLSHPHARFQILGALGAANRTAIPREQLDTWLREGVIEYLGETDDVRPYITQAHCVVLPSYREGVPRSLLEGGAMGRPLITTDAPGCRDVVNHEVNGYLCKVQDAVDLSNKIQRFLGLSDEERTLMSNRSSEKVRNEFDEKLVITRYLDAIDRYRAKPKNRT